MDEEIRRLLLETVEALEAVLVAVQLEQDGEHREPGRAEFATREAVRRVVRLRQELLRPEGG